MNLYATGGSGLRRFLSTDTHLAQINKVAATLMVLVAVLMLVNV
jgi:arginine exporter protein ArgO